MRELTARRAVEEFDKLPDSLFFFRAKGRLRQRMRSLIAHRYFDSFILACIIVSSLSLAARDPLQEQDPPLILYSDMAFTILFTLEMILKVVTFGFIHGEQAYLRNSWNILDFFLVLQPAITLATPSIRSLRTLRTFRSLRPLRLISRTPGLQIAVNCLLQSLRGCMTTMLMGLALFLLFAIPAYELFGGKMHGCKSLDSDGPLISFNTSFGAAASFDPYLTSEVADAVRPRLIQDWLDCTGGASGSWAAAPGHFDDVSKYVCSIPPDHLGGA